MGWLFDNTHGKRHKELLAEQKSQTQALRSQSDQLSEQARNVASLRQSLSEVTEQLRRANLTPEQREAEDRAEEEQRRQRKEAVARDSKWQRWVYLTVVLSIAGFLVWCYVTDTWGWVCGVIGIVFLLVSCSS